MTMFDERATLAPGYTISRVIRGGWQLAGDHGAVVREQVTDDLAAFFDAGITTFDCADIYTGVEDMYGAFRAWLAQTRGAAALAQLRIHTKYVPDLDRLADLGAADVRRTIDRSLQRLRMERLDLVQFHWWDYDQPRWLATAETLAALQREGKIALVGGTNFDTAHIVALAQAGVRFASLQVQYSLLDRRPAAGLAAACAALGTQLLCYGTLAGGFLTDAWLGRPEPVPPFANRSLVKYKLIIDEFGGWPLFQQLLGVLRAIADRHQSSIAAVASRWVLDRAGVAAVIVGARHAGHLPATRAIGTLRLDDADRAAIDAVLAHAQGPLGEVYALERDRTGRHGSIMKYHLGESGAAKLVTQ